MRSLRPRPYASIKGDTEAEGWGLGRVGGPWAFGLVPGGGVFCCLVVGVVCVLCVCVAFLSCVVFGCLGLAFCVCLWYNVFGFGGGFWGWGWWLWVGGLVGLGFLVLCFVFGRPGGRGGCCGRFWLVGGGLVVVGLGCFGGAVGFGGLGVCGVGWGGGGCLGGCGPPCLFVRVWGDALSRRGVGVWFLSLRAVASGLAWGCSSLVCGRSLRAVVCGLAWGCSSLVCGRSLRAVVCGLAGRGVAVSCSFCSGRGCLFCGAPVAVAPPRRAAGGSVRSARRVATVVAAVPGVLPGAVGSRPSPGVAALARAGRRVALVAWVSGGSAPAARRAALAAWGREGEGGKEGKSLAPTRSGAR
jgi:hypothetical protein